MYDSLLLADTPVMLRHGSHQSNRFVAHLVVFESGMVLKQPNNNRFLIINDVEAQWVCCFQPIVNGSMSGGTFRLERTIKNGKSGNRGS
jgi:hypothetical protein